MDSVFKLGMFHWFGYVMHIKERLNLLKATGYDRVLLWWEDEYYPEVTERFSFVSLVKSYGLEVENVHLPDENSDIFWSGDESARISYLGTVLRQMEECKQHGVEKVVMHVNTRNVTATDMSHGFKTFERITHLAEDLKLKVAVENTSKTEYIRHILDSFPSDYLGLCYDSSHDFIEGESKGDILNRYKHRLFGVHLSDNDGVSDLHRIPGSGVVDFAAVVDSIKLTDCDCLAMEVFPSQAEKTMSAEQFLKVARESIKNVANL